MKPGLLIGFGRQPPVARRRRMPARLRWASRIEAWPPVFWLALQVVALWPVLGMLEVPVLLALGAWHGRLACDWPARGPWLAAAAAFTAGSTLLAGVVPGAPAGLAMLAIGSACAAFRRYGGPHAAG